ncbi:DNA repair protein RecO [Dissostichus eleginoides]|nr:DNA repair protein RecO [Dissostichus eleginoides]
MTGSKTLRHPARVGGEQWSVSRCSAVPMGTASAPIYNKSSVTWIEGVPCSHTDDHSLGVKRAEEKHVRTSVLYNSPTLLSAWHAQRRAVPRLDGLRETHASGGRTSPHGTIQLHLYALRL